MKKILLPTDFSDNSFEAIRYALLVYKDVKCTFYLLHTFNPPVYQTEYLLGSPGQIGLGDVLQETSLLKLEQLKKRLEDQYSNTNHTFIIHTAFNTLLNEITEMTQSENIDMIVMGTTGATGAKEILFGSNTVNVIKKSKCPVIAIPPKFEYEAPIEILFPTDFEISYPKKEMEPLLLIARQHKSRINVLHVRKTIELNIVQKENKKQLDRLLVNMAIFHSVADNEIIPAVNQFQEKNKVNLLVMVQNKHSFIEKLFIEPVIKKIGFHITIPFLVIPQK